MANYENVDHQSRRFLLGDNEFRTGVVTVPAGTTYSEGTILQTSSGKFVASEAGEAEVGIAVLCEDVTNRGSSSADIAVRALISGKVNKAQLKVGSSAATDVQADALRQWGIVALNVNEVGQTDNA